VTKPEWALAVAAAFESVLLAYCALAAFLTPTSRHEYDPLLAVVLLALAAPLAWRSVSAFFTRARRSDQLALRVILPNAVVFLWCLEGSFGLPLQAGSLVQGVVALGALVMIVGSIRLIRTRAALPARS
jgi:hypothetical protein